MSDAGSGGGPLEGAGEGGAPRPVARAQTSRRSAVAVVGTPPDAPQLGIAAKYPRRAEITAVALFVLGLLAFAAFGGAYWQAASSIYLGGLLGAGMVAFGAGLVVWGKYLMPRGPFEEERKLMAVKPEERAELIADFATRGKVAVERRGFIATAMAGTAAVFGVVLAFPLIRSLGPKVGGPNQPETESLYTTNWKHGSYLTTLDNQRVKVDDLAVGGILTVFPEENAINSPSSAIDQTVLIRIAPSGFAPTTIPARDDWGPEGYLAYSKVCTHAGCPVSLWEHELEKLVCPCHQSMFLVAQAAVPVFGPAPRPLPQLPLYVDSEGYLRAQRGYDQPIGPGFWSRGGTPAG